MANSVIKYKPQILFLTQTGNTGAYGSIALNVNRQTDDVLWVRVTNLNNAMCIPWRYGNADGYWYAKVLDWQDLSAYRNTNITVQICIIRKG